MLRTNEDALRTNEDALRTNEDARKAALMKRLASQDDKENSKETANNAYCVINVTLYAFLYIVLRSRVYPASEACDCC